MQCRPVSFEITNEAELPGRPNGLPMMAAPTKAPWPKGISMDELRTAIVSKPEYLIENFLPKSGAVLVVAPHKTGKTVLAAQMTFALASSHALMENYKILDSGHVIVVEQDDPAGTASWQAYLVAAPYNVANNVTLFPKHPNFVLGPDFTDWLEAQIIAKRARLVVLDTLTALRPHRGKGCDIVKVEHEELNALDELAKRTGCTILVLHHDSKGRVGMDWSAKAGGTYAITAAVEGQICISRFPDDISPLRLIQSRVRHGSDLSLVVKFQLESLDYYFVMDGAAAPDYPFLVQLRSEFGTGTFTPKSVGMATGLSRPSIHRYIERLRQANAIIRTGTGEYKCH